MILTQYWYSVQVLFDVFCGVSQKHPFLEQNTHFHYTVTMVIKRLHAEKDVEIVDSDGNVKSSASNMKADDIIRRPRHLHGDLVTTNNLSSKDHFYANKKPTPCGVGSCGSFILYQGVVWLGQPQRCHLTG